MDIVYAELVFDEGSKSSCHMAFCVFEDPADDGKRQSVSSGESRDPDDSAPHRFSSVSTTSELSIRSFVEQMEDDLDMEESIKILIEKWKEEEHEAPSSEHFVCSGISVLGDGRIVITTKSGEIAVYGTTGKFLTVKKFAESFQGLTRIGSSKDEFAVSCGYCIRFYSAEKNKVHESDKKSIEFNLCDIHDIHYTDNGFIVLCKIQSQVLIKKIDMNGDNLKVLHQTVTPYDHFCCSSEGETIFLILKDQRKIVAMKQDGSVSWELTIDYIPTYVTLVGEDRIAVSLMGRPDVKCLTLTGSVLTPIDTGLDPFRTPLLLSYSKSSESLLLCPEEIKRTKSLKKNPFSKAVSQIKLQ